MLSLNRISKLSLSALTLCILAPLAGCAADATEDEVDGDVGGEAVAQTSAAVVEEPTGQLAEFFRTKGSTKPALSYGRGLGTIPTVTSTCGWGQDLDAGLCYPSCAAGYYGVGPACWQYCPAGYTDTGAFCQRDAQIIGSDHSSCPWYDLCGVTFARGCSVCPPGYNNDGCTCSIPPDVFAKSTYGRGLGTIPTITSTCGQGQDLDAGLCYAKCEAGYKGVGPVCWLDTITFQQIAVQACDALYDPLLSQIAQGTQAAQTYGFGVGIAAGVSGSAEAGVAYGANGEFGCYFTVCGGVTTDISINAWGSFGVLNSFGSLAGDSIVSFVGMSTELPDLPVGIGGAVGAITNTYGQPQGMAGSVSFGVGISPVQLGTQACHTVVQETR